MLAKTSLSLPFFLASGLSLCALILVILILPESLPPERREAAGQGRIRGPQFGAMRRALSSPIGLLLGMAFLLTFGLTNFESVFGLYALRRFGYDAAQVGGILMLVGVISVFMQGAMTGRLTRRFGEVRVMRVALLISAIGFGLMLLADSLPGVLFTTGFFIFGKPCSTRSRRP
jgi:DHA1 family multidrug resistance protein-like MFS transporter